ncbi:hypothetical protein F4859DRAFT_419303 [Xylaria cf. heliscus]|nr:hypothetical protein F4859DRAFT_419303 [Xylaria cf. heliscus]
MHISGINGRGVFPDPRSKLAGAGEEQQQHQHQQVSPVSHVTTYTPDEPIPNAPHHHHPLAWTLKAISILLSTDNGLSSPAISPLSAGSGSLGKRAADTSPNTLTSIVAGVLVTAFVIFAGIFLYIYRRSIRFRQQSRKSRRHRHRRRASGNSKISQGSDAVGGAGAGADGGAVAADAPAP